jgi:hypothetical protein
VIFDVAMMAALLATGLILFRRFEQRSPKWRRVLKHLVILAVTAVISHYFGTAGVLVAMGIALLPVIFVHAIWLPHHGVNGLTAEPREKYYALRGWAPPEP